MTIFLISVTVEVSLLAFYDEKIFSKLQFNAYQVYHRGEIHRLLTHGFVHASWSHLIVNMLVLYFFGSATESYLGSLAMAGIIKHPSIIYLILYSSSIIIASLISLFRFKDNHWYNSVGASGAVAAVMFFSIFFSPWQKLYLYGVIGIPGIIFAVLYIAYSQYMSKRGGDNINHDAHLIGALYGFVFPLFINPNLIHYFIKQLLSFSL
jgi:membrane associated rhomboid family serine protease